MEQLLIAFGERLRDIGVFLGNPSTQLLAMPLLGVLFICLTPPAQVRRIRAYAAVFSGLSLAVAVLMLTGLPAALRTVPLFANYLPFHAGQGLQFTQDFTWLSISVSEHVSFAVDYSVGVDGLNMPLILLATAVIFLAVIWALPRTERVRDFFALTLLMEMGILGVFVALDYVLFYLFWELMLIPMFFLIAGWGPRREQAARAAIKFFVYTMFGSVFMLIAFIAMKVLSSPTPYSFSVPDIMKYMVNDGMALKLQWRELMFVGLALGFAIKVPMFPFHTWLPDAHTEAPTEMSVILAAVMLKTGAYGLLRMAYPTFPDVGYALGPVIAFCGVVGIVYGAAVTLVQTDFKRMVAYSSISHMGFILLGISAMNPDALIGAVYMMVAHGAVIATLFFLTGAVERRYGTRDLRELGGMLKCAPSYAYVLGLAAFAGMGLPGLIAFWGEFLVLKGTYFNGPSWMSVQVGWMDGSRFLQILAILSVVGILTTAVYMVNMLQRVLPGEMRNAGAAAGGAGDGGAPRAVQAWRGFRLTDGVALVPLSAAIVVFGLYPAPIVNSCLSWAAAAWEQYLRF